MRWWFCSAALAASVWTGGIAPLVVLTVVLGAVAAGRPGPALGRGGVVVAVTLLWLAGGWGLLALQQGLQARLPSRLNGRPLAVRARVVALPRTEVVNHYGQRRRRQRLILDLRLQRATQRWPGRHRVRVSAWAPLPRLHAGDRFRGRVKLYFPHGWYNQAGPDLARVDLSRGIEAHGVLKAISEIRPHPHSLVARRQRLTRRLRRQLAVSPLGQAVIPALVAGDRRGLGTDLWQQFRDCGTAHLLAISGLHLSLVTGVLWWLGRWLLLPLWWPWRRRVSAQQLAWLPALAGAFGYAALAGFGVSTRRALIMVTVLALCRWLRRRPAAGQSLAIALLAVLLLAPLSALSAGLWLSFTAVAMIVLIAQGGRTPLSLALPVVMAVIGAWLFGGWAWWSPLANLVLVPLFSLLVVPLALFGALCGVHGALLASATGVELAGAMMEQMQSWPVPPLPPLYGGAGALVLAAAVLAWLPARPWPRGLLLLWLLPWVWPVGDAPGAGQVDVIVFEVGQGQAIALRTAHHLVLYDLGPRWPGGSAARLTLLPWMTRFGLRPDVTVVSHGDQDHAGGLADLRHTGRLLSGEPSRVPGSAPCRAGQHWTFDGVSFRLLWPRDSTPTGNAASCVLRVGAGAASALLTGDMPAQVEYRLLGSVAPVTVLQLAHHGSDSANTAAWIGSIHPRWAFASAGYANRFGHPRPDVVRRLHAAGVTVLRTDRAGMIVFRLGGPDNAALITQWRRRHPRPWQDPVPEPTDDNADKGT